MFGRLLWQLVTPHFGPRDFSVGCRSTCPEIATGEVNHCGIPSPRRTMGTGLSSHSVGRSGSDEIWENKVRIFDHDTIHRLSTLRKLQDTPNAGLWLTAYPERHTGSHFSPPEFQALLRFRTGLPQTTSPTCTCARCGTPMDTNGDHALSCAASGLYRRHNRIRDVMWSLCKTAGWNPESEIALPGNLQRPADILLRTAEVKPVALDVTVSHPLCNSAPSAAHENVAASSEQAEANERHLYQEVCYRAGWKFRPIAMETTGALGPSAQSFVRHLSRTLCMKTGTTPADTMQSMHRTLNLALAKGCAEMLVGAFSLLGD